MKLNHLKLYEDFDLSDITGRIHWIPKIPSSQERSDRKEYSESKSRFMKNLGIEGEDYYDYFEKGNEDGPKKPTGKIPRGMSLGEWYERLRRFMPETYDMYC